MNRAQTLTHGAGELIQRFFTEGKLKLIGYSPIVVEAEEFLLKFGYKREFNNSCTVVYFSIHQQELPI